MTPDPERPVEVDIFLERFGGYAEGFNLTDFFGGAISEAAIDYPEHFRHWHIRNVEWQSKDFGHIPWGDLLGYWYLTQVVRGEPFGGYDCTQLPGYLPVDAAGYRTIRSVSTTPSATGILDLAASLGQSRLSQILVSQLRQQLRADHGLLHGLLSEMDRRYRDEARDLRVLKPQINAVRALIGTLPETAPLRTRLLAMALDLQDANHDGDPARVTDLEPQYRALRDAALDLDLNLVAHLDANLAVSFSDRFDFASARKCLGWLIDDPRFGALTPHSRGRHMSSLGQQLAISGEYEEADNRFAQALELFDRDPQLRETRDRLHKERAQTLAYRVLNAFDGGLPQAPDLLASLLGGDPVAQAAPILTAAGHAAVQTQFLQHILLRQAWFWEDEDLADAIERLRPGWNPLLPQHPWELIGLYRALLLWRRGEDDPLVQDAFRAALDVVEAAGRGSALLLIETAIALISGVCTDDPAFLNRARENLFALSQTTDSANPIVQSIAEVLPAIEELGEEAPAAEMEDIIERILVSLPFFYH